MSRRESITHADPTAVPILPTIPGMETHTEGSQPAIDFLSPTAGWEAAARWNRATFDWMAKGWQQWVALMTTVPPQFVTPPTLTPEASQRVAEQVRAAQALDTQLRTREPATT